VSVNEEIVHGIPGDRVLRDGDVVSVDCGVKVNGYCGDSAVTVAVGKVSQEARLLLEVTRRALELAIAEIAVGRCWSGIARKMQTFVEGHNLSVVRDFVGHGIGRNLHEEPKIPNYWDDQRQGEDFTLQEGMTLAIEPMVNLGTEKARATSDSWTVVTRDGKYSAHFEHTVAVTASGAEVLTALGRSVRS
jgi:methionyl aminopeptidase